MDSSTIKRERSDKKRRLTCHRTTMKRLMIEGDVAGVVDKLSVMKGVFNELEELHFKYTGSLTDGSEVAVSEGWFEEVSNIYLEHVTKYRAWLAAQPPVATPVEAGDSIKSLEANNELLHTLNLPRIEIPVFSGKAKEYQTFVSIFDELIGSKISDCQIKLTRLVQYCQGPAKEAINQCMVVGGSIGYKQARQILEDRFGNAHLVVQTLLKDLKQGRPAVRPFELIQLADDLAMAYSIFEKYDMLAEANSQSTVIQILGRCHNHVKTKWRKKALAKKDETGFYPDFGEFVKFITKVAKEGIDPLYGYVPNNNVRGSASCNQVTGESAKSGKTCLLCNKGHAIKDCFKFKGMSLNDKYQAVRANKLCFNCLTPFHLARECSSKGRCHASGCGRKHHTLLHKPNSTVGPVTLHESVAANLCNTGDTVFLPIVDIRIGYVRTAALLDSGSTSSLISRSLVNRLGLQGRPVSCHLGTVNSVTDVQSKLVSFDILDRDGRNRTHIHNALVVDRIPAYTPAYHIDKSLYPHLQGIDLPSSRPMVQAELLIGLDHSHIMAPLDVRRDRTKVKSPYAVLTRLGWTLFGSVPRGSFGNKVMVNFLKVDDLRDDIQNLWSMERSDEDTMAWSETDHRVMRFWQKNTSFVNGHYEIPVPWKQRDLALPNNESMARKRLEGNLKKLQQKDMVKIYDVNLNKMLTEGYAEEIPKCENVDNTYRRWYLPHHFVTSPSKPGKVRIVFDCAAKYAGISLNELCHQGPDLVNKLYHVLLRFRQFRYAVTADVESMYHQVRLPVGDRDCFRFLWVKDDQEVTYRMTSHLFGGVWCASSSTYALRRTVQDFPCSDLARDTVTRSFYVDDMLRSAKTKAEATQVVQHTKDVLSKGGFRLTKFVANDLDVLSGVDEDDVIPKIRDITPDYLNKALGVGWDIRDDVFLYSFKNPGNSNVTTKRGILSQVASMYDPLGLVAPIIVTGRMIFQKATKLRIDWDEPIPSDLEREWLAWSSSLNDISQIKFPRCVIPSDFSDSATQLHLFCDASASAYGAACYIRSVNKVGRIHVGLLSSKVRLAPVKQTTIPRLELSAAVLAVTMNEVIQKELDLQLLPSVFWTDSEIVLSYIRNVSLRTKVFVANRVSYIRQNTDIFQWNYVPSKSNAADILSRGCLCRNLPSCWITGPKFLYSHKSEWDENEESLPVCSNDQLELLKDSHGHEQSLCVGVSQPTHPIEKLIDYHSCYYRLRKSIAWLLRVVQSCRSKDSINMQPITVGELGHSESLLISHVQHMFYASEVTNLSSGKPINKTSTILSLSPTLVNGLLVVGGRLKHARVPHDMKHPYILPSEHRLSDLILKEHHGASHLGTEWVLGKVRTKFWIPKARNKLKYIKKQCVTCKRLYGKPLSQKMADLPLERVSPSHAAFHHTGVDCFGPFYVKLGRAEVKRYGCIYTCFTTRAIHLEVLMGLDTQSFLNGFIRFCARRGCPKTVKSDNGTNLVGGKTELAKAFKSLDRAEIIKSARRNDISWSFNPPLASHQGGVWERMIRTVRRVLLQVLNPRVHLTDEVLHTTFCEVENIVNSRPLTKCSDDPSDDTPLSPNHFLLLQGNYPFIWGDFVSADSLRKRWCRVQELATQFWERWVSRYLPELQSRQKWGAECPNLGVGDLVLLVDENTPRGLWPLGLVESIHRSPDGLVRSAKIRTKSTILSRPITKIVLLEGN